MVKPSFGLVLVGLCLWTQAFAYDINERRIHVTGYPVILDDHKGVYEVPNTFKTTVDANFVTVDNVKQVCFAFEQPRLRVLNKKIINVEINGARLRWICYPFDENYFVFSP